MSRQDKATSERHTKVLRELVKRPENKTCADCKRNDPRWASWNLGVFLCIRCSGIHRGMGTHISKVKSVDLDVWTPEQMQSITKWGNHFANLYWEARLKPGHIPPEHKMESFIRSKYESRRWAMDGPPPQDPSVLDTSASAAPAPPEPAAAPRQAAATAAPAPSRSAAASSPTARQPQSHPLLSANFSRATPPPPSQPVTAPAPAPEPASAPLSAQNDIFSLDFHAPAATPPPQQQPAKKDVKNDILSLFSAPPPTAHRPTMSIEQNQWGQFGGGGGAAAAPSPTTMTSMVGANGVGAWGVSSGWSAPAVAQNTSNLWGTPAQQQQQQPQQQPFGFAGGFGGMQPQPQVTAQQAALGGANPWGAPAPAAGASHFGGGGDLFSSFASTPSTTTTTTTTTQQQKKDDAFGDLWGSFK